MKSLFSIALVLLLAAAQFSAAPSNVWAQQPAQPPAVRRIALAVGANDGGGQRIPLRYAISDAKAFSQVMTTLGGVQPDDALFLAEPRRAELMEALARMGKLAKEPRRGARLEAVLYFSGHSDEEGLMLGSERLGYSELRQAIDRIGAEVRIAILDSCSSGTLLRTKGGVRLQPFLLDRSSAVQGHAFLTASAEDEAAQESDRIRASFFTSSLVTGLRGAADASGDGRVTLNEAYAYAFGETLSRTSMTRAGAQHPAYDIQLTGSGDLVMTDLRSDSALLELDERVSGRVFIHTEDGLFVAELRKGAGAPMSLGLEPGRYRVLVDSGSARSVAVVELTEGKRTALAPEQLAPAPGEAVALRGGEEKGGEAEEAGAEEEPPLREVPANFALLPGMSTAGEEPFRQNFALNFLVGRAEELDGAEFGLVLNWERRRARGLQAAAGGNLTEGSLDGAQFAGAFNWAGEAPSRGLQASAGFNYAGGHFTGLQASSGINAVNADLEGAQLSAGLNIAKNVEGLQASGVNLARRVVGAQVAGCVNIAEEVEGAQLATCTNVARTIGTQLGVINVASEVRGAQLGMINVAKRSDYTLGLINIVEEGYLRVGLATSELLMPELFLKMGGRKLYAWYDLGIAPDGSHAETSLPGEGTAWSAGIGFGWHQQLSRRLFIDIELGTKGFMRDGDNIEAMLGTARAALGLSLGPVELFAGPSFNALVDYEGADGLLDLSPVSNKIHTAVKGDRGWQLFPGFMAGAQF